MQTFNYHNNLKVPNTTRRVPVGKLCVASLVCAVEPNLKVDNKPFLLCNGMLTETLPKPLCSNVSN
jgi:hypothetical protein